MMVATGDATKIELAALVVKSPHSFSASCNALVYCWPDESDSAGE